MPGLSWVAPARRDAADHWNVGARTALDRPVKDVRTAPYEGASSTGRPAPRRSFRRFRCCGSACAVAQGWGRGGSA